MTYSPCIFPYFYVVDTTPILMENSDIETVERTLSAEKKMFETFEDSNRERYLRTANSVPQEKRINFDVTFIFAVSESVDEDEWDKALAAAAEVINL